MNVWMCVCVHVFLTGQIKGRLDEEFIVAHCATLVISLMVFPAEAIMLPMYREMADLGWINTWASLIVPFVAKCFSIYMFRQLFMDVPNDLLEAASIDGCGPVKTFFTVVLPISGTVYATIFILDFVAHWNDFMWPLLVVTGEEKRTIQLAIQTFFGSKPINYGPIMASLTISAIPMLIMFLFCRNIMWKESHLPESRGRGRI